MKIIENGLFKNPSEITLEQAVDMLLTGYSNSGSIEQIQADIHQMRLILVRFISMSITPTQLNQLAGFERFEIKP